MFTGLVTDLGTVERVTQGPVTDLWVASSFTDFVMGESIACDGVCLTVVEWRGTSFKVQVAPETLRRSTAGSWTVGTRVNLERALRMGDRLGGHWVQGHVDAVGQLRDVRPEGGTIVLTFSLPSSIAAFFVEKGSVCIDGVSLTVTAVGPDSFSVMLIPETQQKTSLGRKRPGDSVNLEADIIGKYVARMMGGRGGLTVEQLRAAGLA
ncbi:MAG: riboflavin synthase [Archangium gephyra]|uniref:Riboflavin synthase n=1 Tax=Archangium gephyra TaxID=48 RepID=A0A2W5TJ58_9BACT|nr:MAG: riboflavin synthase [Archangium gephyra]